MRKWKQITLNLLAVALCAVTFLGMPQTAAASTGVNVATHTQSEIISYINQQGAQMTDSVTYAAQPSYTQPYVLGQLSDATQNSALKMVNQIRYIAGLPAVKLDMTYRDETQAGALVNAANNSLSHTPSRPTGMNDELYNLGKDGAGMSNLSLGRATLNASIVDGWMGDYTGSNLTAVGHRRWILYPDMGATVFGAAGTCYAMYVFDFSGSSNATGVVWPAQQMPVEYFNTVYPWSYSLGDSIDIDKVKVTLKKRGTGETWNFSKTAADGHFTVDNNWYGQPGCIIFRPDNYSIKEGDIFDVTITGMSQAVSYSVEFFTLGRSGKPDPVVLTNGTPKAATLTAGSELEYAFTAPSAGTYSFYTESNPQVDTMGYLYDSIVMRDDNLIASNDDSLPGQNANFKITATLQANQKVYLKIKGFGNANGSIKVCVSRQNTLSFQANGGSSVPSSLTALQNSLVTIPTATNSKTCKLTLDANGGTVSSASKTYTVNQTGWNTNTSGTGTAYSFGASLTLDKDYTLYVQWEKKKMGELPIPTKTGYTFDGWYTAATGGTKVTADTTISQNKTVYAHWISSLKITSNPANKTVNDGASVKFTVAATGTGLSYQWQVSKDGGKTWSNSTVASATKATLTFATKGSFSGRMYRCVVSDGTNQVTSKTATLTVVTSTPVITTQPANVTVSSGASVKFSVVAVGAKTYQWQVSKDAGKTWANSTVASAKTATLTFEGKETFSGRKYRCVISGETEKVTSAVATLTVKAAMPAPVITTQPVNVNVAEGTNVKFSVVAANAETYQWQYSADGGNTWTDSAATSGKTATLSFTGKETYNGRMYRCVVSNETGKVISTTATLTLKVEKPVITSQPDNVEAEAGAPVKFSVSASGKDLTYQWQYSKDNGATWTNSTASGAKTATMTTTIKESFDGRIYRCVVKNAGGQVNSNSAKLTVIVHVETEKPFIRSWTSKVQASPNVSVTLKVEADRAKTYQWQYSKDGGASWINSTLSSANTAELTTTLKATYDGRLYRCVVGNEAGEVSSEPTEIVIIQ